MKIEKLVYGGQGLARDPNGQIVFMWNALPEEEVEFVVLKKRKGVVEGLATKILTPSKDRIEPKETHWLSSSPWQMMTFKAENYWKRAIAAETYSKLGDMIINPDDLKIVSDEENQYGYRNKMEFSFTEQDGKMSLAFFERGGHRHVPATGSILAEPAINETAQLILDWIVEQKITLRSLKAVIIRSNGNNEAIAALFIKDELQFKEYPKLSKSLLGFHLYYSTHKSPASVPTKLLYSMGQDYLTAKLKNTSLKFGLLSFFQINIPIFDLALNDIAAFLEPKMPVIDFYSGVGSISLPLSLNREQTTLVDNNTEAIAYAEENIKLNKIKNCTAYTVFAEKMTDIITGNEMIILDPPRAGLHPDVISRLLLKKPARIIYLSCDLATHARDICLLSEVYKPSFLKLYNFFPRTSHIEGLCVLDRM